MFLSFPLLPKIKKFRYVIEPFIPKIYSVKCNHFGYLIVLGWDEVLTPTELERNKWVLTQESRGTPVHTVRLFLRRRPWDP